MSEMSTRSSPQERGEHKNYRQDLYLQKKVSSSVLLQNKGPNLKTLSEPDICNKSCPCLNNAFSVYAPTESCRESITKIDDV